MANNLEQQKEMNELLEQQSKFFEAQNKNLKIQSALMMQLISAMKGVSFKDTIEETRQLNELLNETADVGNEAGTATSNAMRNAAEAAEEALEQFEKQHPVIGGLVTGMAKLNVAALAGQGRMRGFNFSIDMFKNIASGVTGLVSSLFNIGVAILSIPFRMWDAFLNMQTGGSNEWRRALEDVRKAFGDLTKNSAADLLKMEKNLNGVIAETGLSTYRIFGNRAEQLDALREYATKLGATFNVLSKSIASSANETERFAAYMKGLGMSDAGIKGVGERAVALGTTVNEIGRQITTFAFQVGEAFGINGRQISADVGEMIGDISHFGNLTVKEMTQAAVFTRKLGLEFKAILGTVEAFDNFDKAAEGAAQLSQAFGMNIDAMQMIREQDPAARFEMLRRSFFATGKAVESMTRQELNLLAAQTGLSAEAVKLGFSAKSQAMSYDQVQKAADGAAKKQLTQEEAMQKLANSIDRMVKSGSQLQGGFIQQFINGFERGIRRSKEFREMFYAIRRALRDTFWAGAQVGRMFVDMFPGVKQFFGGIAGIFDRNRFREMLSNIKQTFYQFFNDVAKNPQEGVQKFLNSLKDNFLNWFNGGTTQGSKVLEGIKSFFKAMIGIVTQLGRYAIQGLIDGAKALVKFIKNPEDLGIESAADGFMGYIIDIFGPLWSMLVEMMPQLGDALWELLTASLEFAWQKLQPYWEEYKGYIIMGMIAWFTGPALIGALAGAVGGFLLKGLGSGIMLLMKGGAARAIGGSSGFGNFITNMLGLNAATAAAPTPPATPPTPAPGFFVSLKATLNEIGAITSAEIRKATAVIAQLAFFIGVGMVAVIGAIVLLAGFIETTTISKESILTATAVVVASAGIVTAIAFSAKAIAMGGPQFAAGMTGLGPLGLFVAGFVVAVGLLALMMVELGQMDIETLEKGSLGLGVITLVLLAMIPLAIASTAVGAAIAASGGLGALTAIAGLGALTTFALAAVDSGKQIIEAAAAINLSSGIGEKVELIISVLQALASLSAAIGTIALGAGLASEDSSGFADNLRNTANLVREIKDAATEFINQVVDISATIDTSQIEKISGIVSIIQGISGFTKTISDVVVAMGADSSFTFTRTIENFITNFRNILNILGSTTESVGISDLIKGILAIEVPGSPEQISAIAKATADILTSLGGFVPAISNVSKNIDLSNDTIVTNLTTFISSLTNGLFGGANGQGGEGGFAGAIRSIIDSMISFAQATTAEDIKKIEPLTKFIGPLLEIIGNISTAVSSLGGSALSGTANGTPIDSTAITSLGTMFTAIFDSLRQFLPSLITGLNTTLSGIDARGLGAKAKALTPVFELITTVQEVISKFYWTARNAGGGMANWQTEQGGGVGAGLGTLRNLFRNEGDNKNNFFSILKDIIEGIKTNLTPELLNGISGINIKSIDKLKTIMEAVGTISDAIGTLKTTFSTDTGTMAKGFSGPDIHNMIAPIASVIKAMTEDTYGGKKLSELLDSYESISVKRFSKVSEVLQQSRTIATDMLSFKNSFDPAMFADISWMTGFFNGVSALADAVARVNEDLINLAATPVEIGANLKRIGDSLGQDINYRIESGRINLTVNLRVNLKADDIANVLIDKEYVVPGAKGAGFVNQ